MRSPRLEKLVSVLAFVIAMTSIAMYAVFNRHYDGGVSIFLIVGLFGMYPAYALINTFTAPKDSVLYPCLSILYCVIMLPYGRIGYERMAFDALETPAGGDTAVMLVPVLLFVVTAFAHILYAFISRSRRSKASVKQTG